MKSKSIFPIILALTLSIGIALFAYFLLIHFMVDDYPQGEPHYYRMNNLLNFYEKPHDGDIFILGSSYVTEGIDAYVIEDSLQKKFINRSVYNLGIHGDTTVERVGEIDYIISSRPKLVIIGLSYQYFDNITFADHVILPYLRKKVNIEEFQPFFSNEQFECISRPSFEYNFNYFFDKRKYLINSVVMQAPDLLFIINKSSENSLKRFPDLYLTNFKDPWIGTTNKTESEKKDLSLSLGKNRNLIPEDLNPQKRALLYMIKKFQQNNISVIIINMPINPLESETINESSRENLSNFLNSTGIPWYDYENEYPSKYFADGHHLNAAGRTDFSPKVATIITRNLINGA